MEELVLSRFHLARIVPPVIAPLFLVLQVLAASVLPRCR
jgi:hypothetical protein